MQHVWFSGLLWLAGLSVASAAPSAPVPHHHHEHHPGALWNIVHHQCLPALKRGGKAMPCAYLKPGIHGYALLKDRRGRAQYLLMPTARMIGIESPALLAPGATNYLAQAWSWRGLVSGALGTALSRNEIALAVNSKFARSQNQLHIHIDCVDAGVRQQLDAWQGKLSSHWRWLPAPLKRQRYRALVVRGQPLDVDPFRLLARDLTPGAGMGAHTLVVVGTTFADGRPGFIVLDGPADLATGQRGSGEALLDHRCRIASPAAAAR
ncbi:CDP-diacylglycerol diphosphatase [Oleiagrimonas sp. C23AA]|uniref:CDP-diacylglycerol diphosphatase n=1 Tax=Oleiagrimonas sp. C23AA TaxID=2719047 RepID=UPI001420D76F|nr:CDP-diacylglycerol diphosphatase [Oleiagrimonas sp. C23AA]NII10275.1 CDP-diacylglycerol diphosphatase [Oleiagrimonas sp. C23AA]